MKLFSSIVEMIMARLRPRDPQSTGGVSIGDVTSGIIAVQKGDNNKIIINDEEIPIQFPYPNNSLSLILPPSFFLNAKTCPIPFIPYDPNDSELERLRLWAISESPGCPFFILGGKGGTGKTRLASELCRTIAFTHEDLPEQSNERELSRVAGFLRDNEELTSGHYSAITKAPSTSLIVVDYAEDRPETTRRLVEAVAARSGEGANKLKVLLILRRPGLGTDQDRWIRGLGWDKGDASSTLGKMWNEISASGQILELTSDPDQSSKDAHASWISRIYHAGVKGFTSAHDASDHTSPGVITTESNSADISWCTRPLHALMAAYLTVHSKNDEAADASSSKSDRLPSKRDEAFSLFIDHEKKYWESVAKRCNVNIPEGNPLLRNLVAMMTASEVFPGIEGSADRYQLISSFFPHPFLTEKQIDRLAGQIYANEQLGSQSDTPLTWHPLQPDLLGEYLVATWLESAEERDTSSYDDISIISDNVGVINALLSSKRDIALFTRSLIVLSRVAERYKEARKVILSTLDRSLLHDLILSASASTQDVSNVMVALNQFTRATGISAVGYPANDDESSLSTFASSCSDLSSRLAHQGMATLNLREELEERAVELYETLATANPAAYTPVLAGSLNNYAALLSEVGRRDKAVSTIEAVINRGDPHSQPLILLRTIPFLFSSDHGPERIISLSSSVLTSISSLSDPKSIGITRRTLRQAITLLTTKMDRTFTPPTTWPSWLTCDIPVELTTTINKWMNIATWCDRIPVIREDADDLFQADTPLNAFIELNPDNQWTDTIKKLYQSYCAGELDTLLNHYRVIEDVEQILERWVAKPTWKESLDFLEANYNELTSSDSLELAKFAASQALSYESKLIMRGHWGILYIAAHRGMDFVYAQLSGSPDEELSLGSGQEDDTEFSMAIESINDLIS
ncbi:MAG: hypothetical protein LBM23_00370 [Propionibacteriaceae bacterium]|nr:hypothetical protein [Propionibacteriaceae bacterium]